MVRDHRVFRVLVLLPLLFLIGLTACEKEEGSLTQHERLLATNNCTVCHMDADQLVAAASEEENGEGENPGEG